MKAKILKLIENEVGAAKAYGDEYFTFRLHELKKEIEKMPDPMDRVVPLRASFSMRVDFMDDKNTFAIKERQGRDDLSLALFQMVKPKIKHTPPEMVHYYEKVMRAELNLFI